MGGGGVGSIGGDRGGGPIGVNRQCVVYDR